MTIKLDSLGGIDWVDGDILEAVDLVAAFDTIISLQMRSV